MEDKKLNLEAMHIYDLRDYARYIGVRSPSSICRKANLIAAIREIESGKAQPYRPRIMQGRKPNKPVQKREYITGYDMKSLKKENFSLVTENLELISALVSIEEIAKNSIKKVRI